MQVFKHMEVLLMLAFGVLCATVAWHPADPRQRAPTTDVTRTAAVVAATALGGQAAAPMPMPIVQVIGHRLTPQERGDGGPRPGAVID